MNQYYRYLGPLMMLYCLARPGSARRSTRARSKCGAGQLDTGTMSGQDILGPLGQPAFETTGWFGPLQGFISPVVR